MKLKRLFTAILSAALTLSLCAMPAMATEGAGTAGTPGTLADGKPVWSKTKGSITIHKFEYNPTSEAGKKLGTGAAGEEAPEGTKALDGVTFHIYKVRDEDWLKAYYSGNDEAATGKDLSSNLDAQDYVKSVDPTTDKVTFKDGIDSKDFVDCNTFTTTGGGIVTAGNLDFGLYLVVETSAPDKVTAPAAPFLVSVPMTRIANSTDTNALTDWIYDVHVYPKNSTTYGQVTIKKNGYTGGDAGVALEGVKFKLQKENGTDWKDITTNDSNGYDYTLTTNTSGEITLAGLSQGNYRIYEDAYSNTSANKGYILDAEYHTFTVQKDGKIKVGETAAIPNATIEVANHRPDMEKTVKKGDSWEHDAQYGVGDTVPYQITIKVPKNIEKLSTFTVTDTPTNLEDKTATIEVVKVKAGTESTDTTLVKDVDYTVTDAGTGTGGFKIEFKCTSENVKACAGRTVTITYNAVVKVTAVVGGNGNSNNAKLEYTNKINSDSTTEPTTNTIEDSAVMYSFGIKVVKTKEDKTSPLKDVEFNLYKAMTAADAAAHSYTALDPDTVTKYGLGDAGGTGNVWACVKSGLKTNAEGIIDTSDSGSPNFIGGLAYGDYYLVETKTAESYNLLTKPVKVELHVTANVQWTTNETFDEHGKLTKRTVETTTFTNANADSTNRALVVAKVINRKGFTLPVTGGFGTLLFSGIGLLLVLVGVSVLFSLKKKTNRA
ncbi:SpaH/EbpB family LPXTG-anchored major pilin [uncultured Gemmiger sp.]|uniref:SpaH/EbpB family LPXTG-anchored major pilin n=1 Tax=uncultured Gemmiger sp. TaxID=1623490 RepID=UPI0027DC60B8|nr:SpaH/EbpB family LPXTG-anchored major pilin [uncultured Gemmiger sp.]